MLDSTNEGVQWMRGHAPVFTIRMCDRFRVEATGKEDKGSAACAHRSCSGVGEVVRENNAIATGRGDGS